MLPPWQLFGLRWPSPGIYRLYGRVNIPRGLHQLDLLLPVSPSLWWAPADPGLHRRTSSALTRTFWFSLLWGHCSFPLGLGACKISFVRSKTEVSVSPVLWKFDNQIPLAFKVRFPQDFQSLCQIPRLGSLMLGSEPPQWRENFFGIIVLQFVGQSPGGHGVWFHHDCAPPTISLRLLCHWALGIFFWWVPAFSSQWLFRR